MIDSDARATATSPTASICIRGETEDEVPALRAHLPSLAGQRQLLRPRAADASRAASLPARKTRYSYRFLFAPGHDRRDHLARPQRGNARTASSTGSSSPASATAAGRPTRRAGAATPRSTAPWRTCCGTRRRRRRSCDFSPYGYDERQYCSPGFNLPVGLFQRSQFGDFPGVPHVGRQSRFHPPEHLATSYRMITAAHRHHRGRPHAIATPSPKCEPQLGRRGLYAAIGGDKDADGRATWPCCGCSISRTARIRCSTSPSAPDLPFRRHP